MNNSIGVASPTVPQPALQGGQVPQQTNAARAFTDLCRRLQANDPELKELRIGWRDSVYLSPPTARRRIRNKTRKAWQKALSNNKTVNSVSIGWRHENDHVGMLFLLKAIATSLPQLKCLKLVLDDWVPATLMGQLLSRHAHNLESVDIRATRITLGKPTLFGKGYSMRKGTLVQVLPHLLMHPKCVLKRLALVECELDDEQAIVIANVVGRSKIPLEDLILRNNRGIGPTGFAASVAAPITGKLDLSLCDMEYDSAAAIAEALKERKMRLRELWLCGNYRLDTKGLARVAQAGKNKVSHLNMSFCDISDFQFVAVLTALMPDERNTTCLQKITLQGSRIGGRQAQTEERSETSGEAIAKLLTLPTLRSIVINDPMDPKSIDMSNTQLIVRALKDNYYLEELEMDFAVGHKDPGTRIYALKQELQYYLRLNRAGRRLLVQDRHRPKLDICHVLANASHEKDILYWLVRNGVDRIV